MGDGRFSLFFVAPLYMVPHGAKRSVKSQAPNDTSCFGPELSTTGPDLLAHIRVPGLGWQGYESMSSSGLGFPMSWRNMSASALCHGDSVGLCPASCRRQPASARATRRHGDACLPRPGVMMTLSASARRHGDAVGPGLASWRRCRPRPRAGVMATLSVSDLKMVTLLT